MQRSIKQVKPHCATRALRINLQCATKNGTLKVEKVLRINRPRATRLLRIGEQTEPDGPAGQVKWRCETGRSRLVVAW